MTSLDIQSLTTQLQIDKARIEEELSTMAVYNAQTDDWELLLENDSQFDADSNDVGDFNEAADEQIATLALLETRYRNIVRALAKVEAGTYGICEISGETIEAARLHANPAARTCLAHLNDEDLLPL